MSFRDWLYAVRDLFGKPPGKPEPPRKANHGRTFTSPHSLPDDVEREWPSKKQRGQSNDKPPPQWSEKKDRK
jgi:hypothetical protein